MNRHKWVGTAVGIILALGVVGGGVIQAMNSHFYPHEDGKVLETRVDNIAKQLNNIKSNQRTTNTILKNILTEVKK